VDTVFQRSNILGYDARVKWNDAENRVSNIKKCNTVMVY